jgi:hypothetical protein
MPITMQRRFLLFLSFDASLGRSPLGPRSKMNGQKPFTVEM